LKRLGSILLYVAVLLCVFIDVPDAFILKVLTASAAVILISIGCIKDEQSEAG
jgi:uncharacterized membrane protein YoaK (UPF0700 family)